MKLGKMSLVAVMALGSGAYAIDNVKVNGQVKVIYQTSNVELQGAETTETGMFENGDKTVLSASPYNGSSAGGINTTLGLTADLLKNVSAGAEVQMYSTLGLDANVFNDNMVNADYGSNGFNTDFDKRTQNASNMTQLWLATTLGKTTLKAGRMELDTPLAFTEDWNIAKNTFEAIVAVNNDIPDTTLVGAWVGKHNGHGIASGEGGNALAGSPGRTVNMNEFRTFWTSGAYAAGAVNKSIQNTTLQAWYYNIVNNAQAYWLQGDTKVLDMVTLGAQYANLDPDAVGYKDSNIWAVKAGVDIAGINLYAAYSEADKDGVLGFANTATGDKTKIYTGDGSIYFDGVVTGAGVDTYKIGAKTEMAGVKLAAAYVNCEDMYNKTVDGFNVSASTKAGPVGLTAIYEQVNNGQADVAPTISQPFYKGRDIETLRLIASLKF